MLASKNRLTGSQLENTKKQGKLHQLNHFGVIISQKDDTEPSRFGFVISNKISKLAIQRNRIKRAVSEAVRHNMTRIPDGYDVIFLVKKSIIKKSTDEIMEFTKDSLKKLKLIK